MYRADDQSMDDQTNKKELISTSVSPWIKGKTLSVKRKAESCPGCVD
jgi:hypothetical protein